MSIPMNSTCYLCHLQRNVETARTLGDDATATAFSRELMQLYLSAPSEASSPWLAAETSRLFQQYYGLGEDRFYQEKIDSNRFAMERLPQIRERVCNSSDPLYAGLQFAILGNYLDFSALQGQVSFEDLSKMLDKAQEMQVDKANFDRLVEDLQKATKLLYLTDNAGEIVFDRVFAETIHKAFPHLQITFCVRGGPAHNDATRKDAADVGIPFPVIDNGNCVGGTEIALLSAEAKQALDQADVIIAKGMGNTETLLGSGYNIYYAFLVKCQRFVEHFGKPKMTPMLVCERQ